MYNLYEGNTGRVRRVEERPRHSPETGEHLRPIQPPKPIERRPKGALSGLSGELGKALGRLSSMQLDSEDLLLAAILYMLYRESGDTDLLIILAAMFFL